MLSAIPFSGTALARAYARPAARRPASIPWGRFDRSRYPEAALAAALDAQASLGDGEYGAVALFADVSADLVRFGAPFDFIDAASRIPAEELRHAEYTYRFAALLRGTCSGPAQPQPLPARDAHASLDDLDLRMASTVAVDETLACALLAACADGARDEVARPLLRAIVRDEVRHARLGWYYLAWRQPQWSMAQRQRVADCVGHIVAHVELARGRDVEPAAQRAARELGVLDTPRQRACVRQVMTEEIVPALDALGLGASHAWDRRARVT